MGLVIDRKVDEVFWIGDDIKITVIKTTSGRCHLHIKAPKDKKILRGELKHQPACATDARATPTEPHEA